MKAEVATLVERGTWRQTPIGTARSRPLPMKWVFTYKFDENGMLIRCKARLCVRGDLQEETTMQKTYAATLAAHAFRIIIALIAIFRLLTKQYDIKNAFTYARRRGDTIPVYCELPDGFKVPGMCVELLRALYGLQDSPALWFEELCSVFRELGLIQSKEEPCLFYSEDRTIFLIFFVDDCCTKDIIIAYQEESEEAAQKIFAGLHQAFELDDKGEVKYFLGIQVLRDPSTRRIFLSHEAYIRRLAEKFPQSGNGTFPSIPIPAIEYHKHTGQADKQTVKLYQEKVGSILYTSIMIRPDMAFAAAKLSQYLTNPSPVHMQAADQAIRYLVLTSNLSLCFGGDRDIRVLEVASDASFADDNETRRSSQGYLFTLFGGPVMWKATRQPTVTTSSTEAELLALQQTVKEAMSLVRLFKDLKFDTEEDMVVHCDNKQTIRLVLNESERINTRLRHVDIHNCQHVAKARIP